MKPLLLLLVLITMTLCVHSQTPLLPDTVCPDKKAYKIVLANAYESDCLRSELHVSILEKNKSDVRTEFYWKVLKISVVINVVAGAVIYLSVK